MAEAKAAKLRAAARDAVKRAEDDAQAEEAKRVKAEQELAGTL